MNGIFILEKALVAAHLLQITNDSLIQCLCNQVHGTKNIIITPTIAVIVPITTRLVAHCSSKARIITCQVPMVKVGSYSPIEGSCSKPLRSIKPLMSVSTAAKRVLIYKNFPGGPLPSGGWII